MNQNHIERLVEASRRRLLPPREQEELEAWLAESPEARAAWAEETALSQALRALPDAPLSPRFHQCVLAAVERADLAAPRVAPRLARPAWWSFALGWRGAAAAVLLLGALIVVPLQQQAQARARLAESVAAMSDLAAWPDLAALADFEAVYYLPTGPLPKEADLAQAFE
jgi:anti-sigma factor RsiW